LTSDIYKFCNADIVLLVYRICYFYEAIYEGPYLNIEPLYVCYICWQILHPMVLHMYESLNVYIWTNEEIALLWKHEILSTDL